MILQTLKRGRERDSLIDRILKSIEKLLYLNLAFSKQVERVFVLQNAPIIIAILVRKLLEKFVHFVLVRLDKLFAKRGNLARGGSLVSNGIAQVSLVHLCARFENPLNKDILAAHLVKIAS